MNKVQHVPRLIHQHNGTDQWVKVKSSGQDRSGHQDPRHRLVHLFRIGIQYRPFFRLEQEITKWSVLPVYPVLCIARPCDSGYAHAFIQQCLESSDFGIAVTEDDVFRPINRRPTFHSKSPLACILCHCAFQFLANLRKGIDGPDKLDESCFETGGEFVQVWREEVGERFLGEEGVGR